MNTHTFKLPSGVEMEVKEMTGKHQRILTEQKNKKLGENLEIMLADLVVRVGSKTDITPEFIRKMLSCDRKKALTEVRQFSNDFDPKFEFAYEYEADGRKLKHDLSIDLVEGFPFKPVLVSNELGELIPAHYSEYSEIEKYRFITLPKSGKKVRYNLLDGDGETLGMHTNEKDRSSHTPLKMCYPCEMIKTDKDETPVSLDLDRLAIKDIEFLRKAIKTVNGQVDTEIMFYVPEKPNPVTIDVLGVMAFFFPSEAI